MGVETLANFSAIQKQKDIFSKLWYDSGYNDTRLWKDKG
jgi:hypothetical protein